MNKKTFLLLRSHTVETVLFNIVACYYQIRLLLYVFVPFIINLLEQNFQKVITLQHSTKISVRPNTEYSAEFADTPIAKNHAKRPFLDHFWHNF